MNITLVALKKREPRETRDERWNFNHLKLKVTR